MQILGTDTRSYYIKMEYEVTGSSEPDIIYEEHGPDEGYEDGEVLQNGKSAVYVKTYKLKYDKETGKLISKDFEARSHYQSKDKIVVRIVNNETTPTESQEPSTETTAPTEAPSTDSTPPETTQATEPVPTETTAATEPATQPTTQATEPPAAADPPAE